MYGMIARLNKKITLPIAYKLKEIKWITPNLITISSFLFGLLSAIFLALGHFIYSAVLLEISVLLDSLDGDLAKVKGNITKSGGFLSSSLDRYVDAFIIIAMVSLDPAKLWFIGCLAILGCFMVSYVRSKAAEFGVVGTIGLGSRDVRLFIIIVGILLEKILETLILVFLIAHITAIHRFWKAFTEMKGG